MTKLWEPLTGRVVEVPAWDARGAFLRIQDAAPVRLTLAVREHLHGRPLRCQDAPGEAWYCTECLAELPASREEQDAHECGTVLPAEKPPAPEVEHKTRTTQPTGYLYDSGGCRRTDRRGRLMYDRSSFAICSCGWVAGGRDREDARRLARQHRESTP